MTSPFTAERLPRLSCITTAVFALSAAAAVAVDEARPLAAGVALALFAFGIVAFLWAYGVAVGRSRTDAIGIGGLFFLAGDVAPSRVRTSMVASLGAQAVVALATASVRPFTSLAFGVLAPMAGLGLSGLWGARYGTFGPRVESRPPPER